jgi:hypothetical protein
MAEVDSRPRSEDQPDQSEQSYAEAISSTNPQTTEQNTNGYAGEETVSGLIVPALDGGDTLERENDTPAPPEKVLKEKRAQHGLEEQDGGRDSRQDGDGAQVADDSDAKSFADVVKEGTASHAVNGDANGSLTEAIDNDDAKSFAEVVKGGSTEHLPAQTDGAGDAHGSLAEAIDNSDAKSFADVVKEDSSEDQSLRVDGPLDARGNRAYPAKTSGSKKERRSLYEQKLQNGDNEAAPETPTKVSAPAPSDDVFAGDSTGDKSYAEAVS